MKRKQRWSGWFGESLVLIFNIWLECICISGIQSNEGLIVRIIFAVLAIVILLKLIVPRLSKMQKRGLKE